MFCTYTWGRTFSTGYITFYSRIYFLFLLSVIPMIANLAAMKFLTSLLIIIPVGLFGQNNLLFEDFNSGFPSWGLFDQDGLQVNSSVSFVDSAWVIYEDQDSTGMMDSCAISTSWYDPAGSSEDWMILPAVTLGPGGNYLSWDGRSEDGSFPESYEIRISTTGSTPADFDTAYFSIASENQYWQFHKISLDSFANQTVNIAFVNVSNDKFILGIDNIRIDELDPAGIEDVYTQIDVFPNPANDLIKIDYTFAYAVNAEIIGVDGRTFNVLVENDRIDISHLSNGLYILTIDHQRQQFRSRLTVAR